MAFLPFLIFEVLKCQVYYFLDESIQKRMEGDLGREKKVTILNADSIKNMEIFRVFLVRISHRDGGK